MGILDTLKDKMQEAKDQRPDPVAEFLNNSGIASILADLDDDVVEPDEALQNLRQELCGDELSNAREQVRQVSNQASRLERERDQANSQVARLESERDQLRQELNAKDKELKKLKSSSSDSNEPRSILDRLRG